MTFLIMAEKKLDRRIIRTRQSLREALLELIIEHGYDDLTITALTARADLRRATFYLHYNDIDELLLAVLGELFDEFVAEVTTDTPLPPFYESAQPPPIQAVLEYVARNAILYRALLDGKAGSIVRRYIRSYLAGLKRQHLGDETIAQLPPDVVANYAAGVETAMIIWWLEQEMPYSPAALAQMIQTLLLQGVQPLFDSTDKAAAAPCDPSDNQIMS